MYTPPLSKAFILETLCLFVYRVHAEHFDTVALHLRAIILGLSQHSQEEIGLSPSSLQQMFTTLVFIANFEAYKQLEAGKAVESDPNPLPGKELPPPGVDGAAFNTLRVLTETIMRKVEGVEPKQGKVFIPFSQGGSSTVVVKSLVSQIVNDAIDHVELAKATQRAVDCVKRSSASSYESFWKELMAISTDLFTEDPSLEAAFLLLAAICKLASEAPRTTPTGELVQRDVTGKLISLELLGVLLKKSGERFQSSKLFGCQVRRMVVVCILGNVTVGVQDARVLRRLLSDISWLWRLYRRFIKVELGVLLEDIVFRLMRFWANKSVVTLQMSVIGEVLTWLEIPQSLVELYLNFDIDRKHWHWFSHKQQTFRHLCAVICTLAEDLGSHLLKHEDDSESTFHSLYLKTLEAISQLARSLMDTSGHANLIPRDAKIRAISTGQQGGWEPDVLVSVTTPKYNRSSTSGASGGDGEPSSLPEWSTPSPSLIQVKEELTTVSDFDLLDLEADGDDFMGPDESPTHALISAYPNSYHPSISQKSILGSGSILRSASSSMVGENSPKRASSIRVRQEEQQARNQAQLTQALQLYKSKGLKKAIQYLVACDFMSDTPRDIASFLRIYRDLLDPVAIGDYLGEGGIGSDTAYYNLIRLCYVRAISFHNMSLEQALRHFLTNCGFRLPGEAQKLDRLISVFAECYFDDNQGTPICPFTKHDTVYVLAYALIILQTDLHKANVKKSKRMSKDAFMANLRGVDDSAALSKEFLGELYDAILRRPLDMNWEDPNKAKVEVMNREGEEVGGDCSGLLREMGNVVKDADELLGGLAVYPTRFNFVGVDVNLSPDLVRLMFESVWLHFHAVVNSVLENPVDPEATIVCLDIIRYAISASIFLGLRIQRSAFATQLAKFKYSQEKAYNSTDPHATASPLHDMDTPSYITAGEHEKEGWFQDIRSAKPATAWAAIGQVHSLICDLKDSVQQSRIRAELRSVAKRIETGARLLEGSRRFIREGDLVKKCRSGKSVTYRFFLFSDQLIYAHRTFTGEYRVHNQLVLSIMKVNNGEDRRGCSFHIHHPQKSFVVFAESAEMKRAWLSDIHEAIEGSVRQRLVDKQLSLASRLRLESDRVLAILAASHLEETPSDKEEINDDGGGVGGGDGSVADVTPSKTPYASESLAISPARHESISVTTPGISSIISTAYPELELEATFLEALKYYEHLVVGRGRVDGGSKAALYGLFMQFRAGDCTAEDTTGVLLAAWKSYSGLSAAGAKAAFIEVLDRSSPGWRDAAQIQKQYSTVE